ncbi:GTPase-activator protein [Dictyocaulus viviparus]|uniref:GTPase-activator protein n=1 Tax=Dictyocaulus viviparus TaxID=29172 RepID=A0A0D8XYE2_DICVI|nr:GTPase-activator protein [Dictyocaulus viviparus]
MQKYNQEAKKLRISSNDHSSEWLEMRCEETGTLSVQITLWQQLLRGFSSTFHGQIRVDIDEGWTNGASRWFYLHPRHNDHLNEAKDHEMLRKLGSRNYISTNFLQKLMGRIPKHLIYTDDQKQQLGDMKLWLSYTADHVLPIENYSYLMTSLATSPNVGPFSASLACLLEHLPKVDLGVVARPIVHAMINTQQLRPLLNALYAADIQQCQDLNTLFRSHTLASKMLYELLKIYGHSYLIDTLKPVIDKIYKERRCCEVDPNRMPQGETDEKNLRTLLYYFSLVFACITESTSRCPSSIRVILSDLRMVVRQKTGKLDVEFLALSSFLIMRFFAAAVLSPKSFGIKSEQPKPNL